MLHCILNKGLYKVYIGIVNGYQWILSTCQAMEDIVK